MTGLSPFAARLALGPIDPLELVPLLLVAGLYARRAVTLSREGRAVPGWRQACFHGGLALTVLAQVSPVGHASEQLLFAHMIEHLLMGDFAALMLVLGLTGPLIAPVLRIRVIDRLRILAHPAIAFPLWAIDLYVWHIPAIYQAALRHSTLHGAEHIGFILCGANMWMCLFGPLPQPAWFGNLARLGYIVAVRLAGAILGNVFVWSGKPFYPYYRPGEALWHVSPRADQSIAGSVMMVEGSILTLCLFCWLFLRAAREGEERQELLDFARASGVELSDRRAARAVAAGRGADLRRRLERSAEDPSLTA